MPSSRSGLQIIPRQAGYPDEKAASSSAGTTGPAAGGGCGFRFGRLGLTASGSARPEQSPRGDAARPSPCCFLLGKGELRNAFPVAIGMPGWEPPTGHFEVLQKILNPVWVHPVSGERVEE